jgi:DNA-binding MarR family transcriptional regulator
MWLVHGDADKVPFEQSVKEYIRDHPGATIGDCASDLGISAGAVETACASLIAKGEAREE